MPTIFKAGDWRVEVTVTDDDDRRVAKPTLFYGDAELPFDWIDLSSDLDGPETLTITIKAPRWEPE